MTGPERREAAKLAELLTAVRLDPNGLSEYPRRDRLLTLERMQRQVVVGAVLFRYTYVDELLATVVAWDFFDRKPRETSFSRLWRTKKFRAFNYHVLDQRYLAQKLRLVQYLHPVPRNIASTIMALNDLRNAMAHSLFPENRKQKPAWNGKLIFDVDGVAAFESDIQEVVSWIWSTGLLR